MCVKLFIREGCAALPRNMLRLCSEFDEHLWRPAKQHPATLIKTMFVSQSEFLIMSIDTPPSRINEPFAHPLSFSPIQPDDNYISNLIQWDQAVELCSDFTNGGLSLSRRISDFGPEMNEARNGASVYGRQTVAHEPPRLKRAIWGLTCLFKSFEGAFFAHCERFCSSKPTLFGASRPRFLVRNASRIPIQLAPHYEELKNRGLCCVVGI